MHAIFMATEEMLNGIAFFASLVIVTDLWRGLWIVFCGSASSVNVDDVSGGDGHDGGPSAVC